MDGRDKRGHDGGEILKDRETDLSAPTAKPLFLGADARELLLEARQPATTVEQLLLAAGPGRMGLRVNVQMQRIARLAPGGTRGELAAISHDDFDRMIFGMNFGFHC